MSSTVENVNNNIAMFPKDLILFDVDNDVFTASRQKYHVGEQNKRMYKNKEWRVMTSQICTITFWGGRLFNCGEYELSSLLLERSQQLLSLTCYPAAGVHMVRPLYCRNNRAGRFLFPVLQEITMMDCGSPLDHGLVTPNLRRIEIILRSYNVDVEVEEWISLVKARKLYEENKNLEEIRVVLADTRDNSMTRSPVLQIFTPQYQIWEKKKLLFLAMYKESSQSCPVAILPYDMLRNICTMVSGSWVILKDNMLHKVVGF